jgi:hypothetical protein
MMFVDSHPSLEKSDGWGTRRQSLLVGNCRLTSGTTNAIFVTLRHLYLFSFRDVTFTGTITTAC